MNEGDLIFAPQRSGQWLAERCGKVTASRFKDVLAMLKNGNPGEKRETYMWEIVIERLTGLSADHFTSSAMQWGTDQEARARMSYEAKTGAIVEEVGFIVHPDFKEEVGGSPDGLIGEEGGFEAKCPFNSAHHLRTILEGMPPEHIAQIQGLMWITGRRWWDFASFDPRMPEPFDLYVQRIPRDEEFIAKLGEGVDSFLADVDTKLTCLRAWAPTTEPPTTEAHDPTIITPEQVSEIERMCRARGIASERFLLAAKTETIAELPAASYARAVAWIERQPATIEDEAVALRRIDTAADEGAASAVLDLCKSQPFYPRAVEAYKARFAEGRQ